MWQGLKNSEGLRGTDPSRPFGLHPRRVPWGAEEHQDETARKASKAIERKTRQKQKKRKCPKDWNYYTPAIFLVNRVKEKVPRAGRDLLFWGNWRYRISDWGNWKENKQFVDFEGKQRGTTCRQEYVESALSMKNSGYIIPDHNNLSSGARISPLILWNYASQEELPNLVQLYLVIF